MTGKRRAAKWLCVRGMLKTNRPISPICIQEVAEYQQDRCPANAVARKGGRGENAAACGGLADGECRYRDAVFFGGTDLPFPRRGRETAAAKRGNGETAAKRRNGEAAKRRPRRNGENGNGGSGKEGV